MWSCHNGANQRFEASYDVTKPLYKSTNLRPGRPFFIQSRMRGRRVFAWGKHIGGGQYQVVIRKPQYTKDELFVFDPRTGHVRSAKHNAYAIAVQAGKNQKLAKLVLRKAVHDPSQKWRYRPGQYHNWSPFNNDKLCMDVYWGKDKEQQPLIMYTCHNGWNQRFEANYNTKKPMFISTGIIRDKPFMIRSRMHGNRVLFFDKPISKGQYGIAIRTAHYDKREIFIFDAKTGHLRNAAYRNWVLAVQQGRNNRGARLVLRKALHDPSQKWKYRRNRYHNWSPFSNSVICMDVAGAKNRDGQAVMMWSCHNGANQRFEVSYRVVRPEIKTSLKIGKAFMIRSKMGGGRVLALNPRQKFGGNQYGVIIQKPRYNAYERFVFDKTSGVITLANNRQWFLALQGGRGGRGTRLVFMHGDLRKNRGLWQYHWKYKPGGYHNWAASWLNGLCLDVWRGRDADYSPLIVWSCHRGANQRFEPDYNLNRPTFTSTGIMPRKPFMIVSKMRGGRVLYWAR